MAVSSNRSPSPLSSRPNPTHSRNSESNSTIRRSFSGNPFQRPSVITNPKSFNPVTPANSPAGFGRRNSVGKDVMGQLQSCNEKENEKHHILKPMKVRSPASGSKNFMSPTISAASKFTPSPRKKPLVERNEPVRTSISLSDGKATFFSSIFSENTEDLAPKSEHLSKQEEFESCLESPVTHLDQEEAALECPPASKAMKRVTFAELPSDSQKETGSPLDFVTADSECLTGESNLQNKTSCFSVSHVIDALDADPSDPPYDPKTNYLSPRPQFLHYKPNPRIEVLLHNKGKGLDSETKRLEDTFTLETSCESFSDNDYTEEPNSDDSNKVSEGGSSAGTEEAEVKEEEEKGLSDRLDVGKPILHEATEKIVGRKWRFFTSLRFASLLLVFLISVISISVANRPVMNSSFPKGFSFSELYLPSGVSDTAKANFDAFTGRFKQLSFDSIYHLSLLVTNLGGHDNLSSLKFINLTDIQKDVLVGRHIHISGSPLSIGPNTQNTLKFQENSESIPLEEEAHEGTVSDATDETETDGEIDLGTQELTSTPASVPQMKGLGSLETVWVHVQEGEHETREDDVFDATVETEPQREFDSGTQGSTSIPPQMKEPRSLENVRGQEGELETSEGDASDATDETEPLGEFDLETQELTCNPAPVLQLKESPLSLEIVWNQEEEEVHLGDTQVESSINVEDCIDLGTKVLEAKSDKKTYEVEFQSEQLETAKLEGAIDLGSEAKIMPSVIDINLKSNTDITPEMVNSPIDASEITLSPYFIPGVISIVLALILAAAYVYLNRDTNSNSDPAVQTDRLLSKKVIPGSVLDQNHHQRQSSQNWTTEVDVMGETCSTEMSSFQTRLFDSRLRSSNEAQSQERKPRKHKRESLASSSEYSTGSPSYGSFTTYVHSKCASGDGDEEIMTPVRRSSRIRKLVTSP